MLTLEATSSFPSDPADVFTFDLDWDNDGTYDERVTGETGTQVTHVYTAAGTYVIGVRAIDKNLQSVTATHSVRLTGYWQSEVGPAFSFARTGASAVNSNGRIYVLGGQPYSPDESMDARSDYLPAGGDTWIQGAYLASNISGQGAGVDALGRIIVFAGFELGHGQGGDAYVYDVIDGKTSSIALRTGSPWGFAHATDDQGFIYAAGGERLSIYPTAGDPNTTGFERYNATTDTWEQLAPLPVARAHSAAVYDGVGHILMIGGSSARQGQPTATILTYDIASDTWLDDPYNQRYYMPQLPVSLNGPQATVGADGMVYITGGAATATNYSGSTSATYVLDPQTRALVAGPAMNSAHAYHSSVLGDDGFVYVIGGSGTPMGQNGISTVDKINTFAGVPPEYLAAPQQYAVVGEAYDAGAFFKGNPRPTFALVSGPEGMSVDAQSGALAWTPTIDQVGVNSVTLQATNEFGSTEATFDINTLALPPDVHDPTAPSNLRQIGGGLDSITFAWDAATDNRGVDHYKLYRYVYVTRFFKYWKVVADNIAGTEVTVSSAVNGKYRVSAVDAAGNEGPTSAQLSAAKYTVPVLSHSATNANEFVYAIVGDGLYVGDSSQSFTPAPYVIGDSGNPKSTLSALPSPAGVTVDSTTRTVSWVPTADDVGARTITIHGDNPVGSADFTFTVDVHPAGTDLIRPTTILTPTATALTHQGATIAWNSATDNVGVVGQRVYGRHVGTTTSFVVADLAADATTHTITTLDPETAYMLWVSAYDAAGNEGPHVGTVSPLFITTLADPNNRPVAVDDAYSTNEDTPLAVSPTIPGVVYIEPFDGFVEPSSISAAGWSIVTGTNNPAVVSGDFAVEDNLNVNKITAVNDSGFNFTSGHLFLEHDINETIVAGYGFGETFVYTDEIVAQNGGLPLDLNGKYLSVDFANGLAGPQIGRGPSFQFAVRTGTSWFVAESSKNVGLGVTQVTKVALSTDPLDSSFSFIPITVSPGAYNADTRILYQDTFARSLTSEELANITAVGILTYPSADGFPARFDNFMISTTPNPGPAIASGVLSNDSDPDGDSLTALLVDSPANGVVSLNSDGSFTYTPNANFNGTDSFTYTANDGALDSIAATVNITVTAVNDPFLEVSVDTTSISENGGAATGTVTRTDSSDISQPLEVTFASNDTTEAAAPAPVTILANELSATFPIAAADDNLLDGPQVATIAATAAGFVSGQVQITVTDYETLAITLPATTVTESDGPNALTGTVTRSNTDTGTALTVSLASDDETEARVPATVVIPIGQTSADFSVEAVDELLADGDQVVQLTASASGYTGAAINLTVLDDDLWVTNETVNASSANRSGVAALSFEFPQAVTVSLATSLQVLNQTTGNSIDLSAASLQGNGTTAVTWDLSSVNLPNGRYTAELPATAATNAGGLPLASTHTYEFLRLQGDVNGDGAVNFADYGAVGSNFDPLPGTPYRAGDANGDGAVNFADYGVIGANFNPLGLASLAYDLGDAPEASTNYPTTLAKDGAVHVIGSGLFLGTSVDSENDGQPHVDALGDDNVGDDEDGVTFGSLTAGSNADVTVVATVPSSAVLNAWVDFNADGDWSDPGEQIFTNEPLFNDGNALSFNIPAGTAEGDTFARFRVTTSADYSFTGMAPDGEVEDYKINIGAPAAPSESGGSLFLFVVEPSAVEIEYPARQYGLTHRGPRSNDVLATRLIPLASPRFRLPKSSSANVSSPPRPRTPASALADSGLIDAVLGDDLFLEELSSE